MAEQTRAGSRAARRARLLLALSYVGFVSLGLPDTVLGAAWPEMRRAFGLPVHAAGAALALTTGGVVLSSMASSRLRARLGTSHVLILSTLLAAGALLGTALAPSWSLVLAASLVAGLGGGAIDASLNDHVARHHSARHMSFLHAAWGAGATIAPLVVSAMLTSGRSFRLAYGALGVAEVVLSFAFVLTRASWDADPTSSEGEHALDDGAEVSAPASQRTAERASVALFLLYGGLEAGTGLLGASWLSEARGLTPAAASAAIATYWGALLVGRLGVGLVADRVDPARILRWTPWLSVAATLLLTVPGTPASLAMFGLSALGLSLAPIYPLAMHDTPHRFGTRASLRLVGQQVAAASLGVATLPWLLGAITSAHSLALLPALLCGLALLVALLERARRSGLPR